jgi:hypothetical protein
MFPNFFKPEPQIESKTPTTEEIAMSKKYYELESKTSPKTESELEEIQDILQTLGYPVPRY